MMVVVVFSQRPCLARRTGSSTVRPGGRLLTLAQQVAVASSHHKETEHRRYRQPIEALTDVEVERAGRDARQQKDAQPKQKQPFESGLHFGQTQLLTRHFGNIT